MSLLNIFNEFVKTENLFQQKDQLLIAVSGGVDSVVLCDLCKRSGYDFAMAHCNFQLRGDESEEDENFVRKTALRYEVDFFCKRFDTENYATVHNMGIQAAARELRYDWLKEMAGQPGHQHYHYILTAHHANDNIETLLMNFFKGTGVAGLQGIRAKSGLGHPLVRPLLAVKKEALLQYANEQQLAYREDSSNNADFYTRNYFRNKLIPSIREVFPQVEDNLLDNIRRFNETEILYRQSVNHNKRKLLFEKENEIHIPVLKLLKSEALRSMIYEIIKDYGFSAAQVEDVVKLLKSESGKFVLSKTYRILHNRDWLIISKIASKTVAHFLVTENDHEILFDDHKLTVQILGNPLAIDAEPGIAQLDVEDIKFPLLLRKWKQGDYFYPLGMKKKKKLSRFFIDQKLSLPEKERTWVIESNKRIIWVVGRRIDDRFKMTGKTKSILKLSLSMA